MRARLTYLAGSRAGQVVESDKPQLLVGRHPQADVRFAPAEDLTVSSRHAAIVRRDALYVLRDLASTNGTFVDGQRVDGEAALRNGAVIQLGTHGPTLRFEYLDAGARPGPTAVETVAEGQAVWEGPVPPTPIMQPAAGPMRVVLPEESTLAKMQRLVLAQTRGMRWGVLALAALVVALALVLWRATAATDRAAATERAELLGRMDSLIARLRSNADTSAAIRADLAATRAEAARLRSEVASTRATARELPALRRRVDSLVAHLQETGSAR